MAHGRESTVSEIDGLSFEEFCVLARQWEAEVAAESRDDVMRAASNELPPVSNGMSDNLKAYFKRLEDPAFAAAEADEIAEEMDAIFYAEFGRQTAC